MANDPRDVDEKKLEELQGKVIGDVAGSLGLIMADMGDPVGASAHILSSLSDGGTFMLVEPLAGDTLEENMHPLGQIYYSFSTMICAPASKAQEVGLALGAQAGEKRLTEVLNQAGFTRVRRAAETPTNMVLEARA